MSWARPGLSTCHEPADLVRAVGSLMPAQCQPLSLASAHHIDGPGVAAFQGTHNANTHLDAVEDAAHGRASASRCRSVSLHLDAARI